MNTWIISVLSIVGGALLILITTLVVNRMLIPRYKGDVKNPKGGVKGVIPNKQKY